MVSKRKFIHEVEKGLGTRMQIYHEISLMFLTFQEVPKHSLVMFGALIGEKKHELVKV